ncbi:MAG TPA: tyrosine-type recombinase/integrase [Verrucomicrobiae bacterium]|nr:tyrosine-type recombinase/integrase [Verrucomicrobiae bacterium]
MQSHSDRNPCVALKEADGPLHSYIPDFTDSLANRGYSKACIAYKVHLVRAFDQWMRQRRIKMQGFTEKRIQGFIRHRAKRYSKERGDAATLRSLLKRLQEANVVSYLQPKMSALDQLQLGFAQYLTEQRGLRPKSVRQYLFHTRRFLVERFADGPLSLSELNAQDIVRCILRQARIVSPHAARCMAKALRSLLRFLQQSGKIVIDLAARVPSVANWNLSGLPKYLLPQQVKLVLRKSNRDDPIVQRDRVILLLLARLGLRAAEIVEMTLGDIDWEAGELTIRGKGGQLDKLPLPEDVGRALAHYLKQLRPPCTCRRVFIRSAAPHEGFSDSAAVDIVVQRALRRAGINAPTRGAHLFRHSLATQMLRNGASMSEIAKILRHQSEKTTAIYAKVDLAALRSIAHPWPGGVA